VPAIAMRRHSGAGDRFLTREAGEHLCWVSSLVWRSCEPFPVLGDEQVGEGGELSDDGDEGELGGFSVGAQASLEGSDIGVVSRPITVRG